MTHEDYVSSLLIQCQDYGVDHLRKDGATKEDAVARWIAHELWTVHSIFLGSRPQGQGALVYSSTGDAEQIWDPLNRDEVLWVHVGPQKSWRVEIHPEAEHSDKLAVIDTMGDRPGRLGWFIGQLVPVGPDNRWKVEVSNLWFAKPGHRPRARIR